MGRTAVGLVLCPSRESSRPTVWFAPGDPHHPSGHVGMAVQLRDRVRVLALDDAHGLRETLQMLRRDIGARCLGARDARRRNDRNDE